MCACVRQPCHPYSSLCLVRVRASNGKAPGGKPGLSADSEEEYWTPMEPISCPVNFPAPDQSLTAHPRTPAPREASRDLSESRERGIPVVVASGAALVVGLTSSGTSGELVTDVTALLPIELIGGTAFQVLCAAVVWYTLGAILSGSLYLMQSFVSEEKEMEDKEEGGN